MSAIRKRLATLQRRLAPLAPHEDPWGPSAQYRDLIVRHAAERGASFATEVKRQLDEIGPGGLWLELVGAHLNSLGYEQQANESFAETMTRALGIGMIQFKGYMSDGRLGTELLKLEAAKPSASYAGDTHV